MGLGLGLGLGCRVQGAGCRVQGAGCRVQGSGSGFEPPLGTRLWAAVPAAGALGVSPLWLVRKLVPWFVPWFFEALRARSAASEVGPSYSPG